MSNYLHNDPAWAEALETSLSEYIADCYDSVYDDDEDFETISGQPFCGCSTCDSRETIMFLIPRIIYAYKEGILSEE